MKDLIERHLAERRIDEALSGVFTKTSDSIGKQILDRIPSAQPEPCSDAVSRNAIIQKLNTMDRYVSEELILCDTDKKFPKNEVFIVDDVYEEIVENLSSVQPERKKGKWIKGVGENGITTSEFCSCCRYENKHWCDWNFCPNCGADLRGD